jgi:hypothetical protein
MLNSEMIPNWHQKIIQQLNSDLGQLFIAGDPDCLLSEENLQKRLLDRKFNLYFFEDSIDLRYFLGETIQNNKDSLCIISVDTDEYDIDSLPYDILKQSQEVAISLGDCFPDLSYSVLSSLQPEELNALDVALEEYTPGKLNESASSDFVLRHVFKLAPEVIQTTADLLKSLLGIHYRDIELPKILKKRLVVLLSKKESLSAWPIDEIVSNKQAFFSFLQEHWPAYVTEVIDGINKNLQDSKGFYEVTAEIIKGLPFGHDDVRIYIDNLFLEGFLKPIDIDNAHVLKQHWSIIGVQQDKEVDLKKRQSGLLDLCQKTLPKEGDRHQQWLSYVYRWAALSACFHMNPSNSNEGQYTQLQKEIDHQFSSWMMEKYASLHNHPPSPPVMLHHVPRAMARELDGNKTSKTAMILIDGLAIDQWVTLKANLDVQEAMNESAVFAWVPTVTSVSRQALFSAKAPYQFSKTINTTSSEPKAWRQFWADHDLDKSQVHYEKSLGTDNIDELIERLSDRRFRAVGLVINTVDDMMHGMQLGAAGMHNQVKLWAQSNYLQKLIDALLVYGFSIHITSDHGNVEAIGSGKINEGAIAESRGERTRVYETETLRNSISFGSSEALAWPQIGLPTDYWPIVMKGREAFIAKGERIVGHGGIALEEVVVPYITIKREIDE